MLPLVSVAAAGWTCQQRAVGPSSVGGMEGWESGVKRQSDDGLSSPATVSSLSPWLPNPGAECLRLVIGTMHFGRLRIRSPSGNHWTGVILAATVAAPNTAQWPE